MSVFSWTVFTGVLIAGAAGERRGWLAVLTVGLLALALSAGDILAALAGFLSGLAAGLLIAAEARRRARESRKEDK